MKCWLHKWELKKVFVWSLHGIKGYECTKCQRRKIKGDDNLTRYPHAGTWSAAIEWRDHVPCKPAVILKIVK